MFTGFIALADMLSKDDQQKLNQFLLTHAETGDSSWMKSVIEQGAQVCALDTSTDENILHKAARGTHESSLKYALRVLKKFQIKKFINALNSSQETPLHSALSYRKGSRKMRVEMLLEAGADPSLIKNKSQYGSDLRKLLKQAKNKANQEKKVALNKTVFLAGGAVAAATAGLVFFSRQRAKTF